jgi:hypothetical protein
MSAHTGSIGHWLTALQHASQKWASAGSVLLLRMLREGKMRLTFRNIQDGLLAA